MARAQNLALGEMLTIAQVQALYARMGELLGQDSGSAIAIDASKLIKLDAAGVQLLTVFLRELKHSEKKVEFKNPAPVLIDSFKTLGLDNEIEFFLQH